MINILLVESKINDFDSTAAILEKDGFNVCRSYNFYDAYDKINNMIFEIIIINQTIDTDLIKRFLIAIREKTFAQIVVLGVQRDDNDAYTIFSAGADDFHIKPVSDNFILYKVRSIIRRNEFISENTFTFGNFQLDYENSQCLYKNVPLPLTNKEYRIFVHLFKNSERVVSKQELYELIWEAPLNGHSDALWAAISRLKKKIAPYENEFSIDSNREGYQLYIRK